MNGDDNILAAGSNVAWSDIVVDIAEIEKTYGFPQIVKVTSDTSEAYGLPENEPVMLYGKKLLTRTVAQTVEEGHYVMGKQLDISSDFVGSFRISDSFERDKIPLKTFKSIQDVVDFFPPKIYVLEPLTVSSTTSSGGNAIQLNRGDELTLVGRSDVQPVVGNPNKPASRFISKVRSRSPNKVALIVHNTRLDENIHLPVYLRGTFATRSPIEVAQAKQSRDMSLVDLLSEVNYPITVIVTSNRTRSPKDEFILRSGMHLKLMSVEEHDIVLAITPFQRITEFSATGLSFLLPSAIVNPKENLNDRNKYQTYLQSTYMATQLQSSATNIDNYCKSVRFHIPRHLRPTNPRQLPANSSLRQSILKSKPPSVQMPTRRHVSAIHLISRIENTSNRGASSRVGSIPRRSLPTPNLDQSNGPPLPPRNAPSPKSPRRTQPSPLHQSSSESSAVPPVPPKSRGRNPQAIPSDVPSRPAPVPFLSSVNSEVNQSAQNLEASSSPVEKNKEEDDIWEEWNPPDNKRKSSNSSSNKLNGTEETPVEESAYSMAEQIPRSIQSKTRSSSASHEPSSPSSKTSIDLENDQKDTSPDQLPPPDNSLVLSDEMDVKLSVPASQKDTDCSSLEVLADSPSLMINGSNDDIASRSLFSEDTENASGFTRMSQKTYVTSPDGWTPQDDVKIMSVLDVTYSLRHIGLSEDVVQYFFNERIDGLMLTELSEDILADDFHLGKLYRHKITRFVAGWRPKLSNESS